MRKATIAGGVAAGVLALLAVAVGLRAVGVFSGAPGTAPTASGWPAAGAEETAAAPGLLYGRVTTEGGEVLEGRLRFGGGQEAFWSDTFYGVKKENPWAAYAPTVERTIALFGVDVFRRQEPVNLRRPFVARFGDLVRIENGADVRVTLKSGTAVVVDRYESTDFDDGVRVWDAERGVVDLVPRQIETIEFLPAPGAGDESGGGRLYGTVEAVEGTFTGFVQWNQLDGLGSDRLDGRDARDAPVAVPFAAIRSIERLAVDSSRVTLADGRQLVLSGTREVGQDNGGVHVDDLRYGRVLVPWNAFLRVDFARGDGGGPAYDDFPPGQPLTGSVTTRDGRRLAGRLVYDFDESQTVETLDASSAAVQYTLPFGLVASIELPAVETEGPRRARVTLHNGEALELQPAGDLDDGNVGVLVFADGGERPVLVPWSGIARIDLERPAAMYPPFDGLST